MPRDRGPVKAYVRDLVDSRRHLIGLFMPLAAVVFVSLVVPVPRLQSTVSLLCMAMLVVIAIEGVLLGRRVGNAVRERFPKEQASGLSLGWYAFSRASQLRKLRVPKPRVKVGERL
jgi:drug/metabolite transporter (DMT)-like permease